MSYEKWMYVKNHEKGAKKLFAKLMLNNLYGKFVFERNIDYLLEEIETIKEEEQ